MNAYQFHCANLNLSQQLLVQVKTLFRLLRIIAHEVNRTVDDSVALLRLDPRENIVVVLEEGVELLGHFDVLLADLREGPVEINLSPLDLVNHSLHAIDFRLRSAHFIDQRVAELECIVDGLADLLHVFEMDGDEVR